MPIFITSGLLLKYFLKTIPAGLRAKTLLLWGFHNRFESVLKSNFNSDI